MPDFRDAGVLSLIIPLIAQLESLVAHSVGRRTPREEGSRYSVSLSWLPQWAATFDRKEPPAKGILLCGRAQYPLSAQAISVAISARVDVRAAGQSAFLLALQKKTPLGNTRDPQGGNAYRSPAM